MGDSAFNEVVALTLEDGVRRSSAIKYMPIGHFGVTLEVERGSIGPGATLDDVNVTNDGVVQVDQSQLPTTTLTLEDGTIITGGTLSIGSSGIVDVEVGPEDRGGNNEYSFDAQLDHVTVTNGGIIEVDLNDDGAVLNLADGTSITGGTLDVGTGEVYVQSGFNGGVTLDHVTVTMDNSGEIEIGTAQSQGSTLVLEDGTTITGGTLSLDDTGDTVEILFGTNDIGATFDHVQVENSGTIQVGSTSIFRRSRRCCSTTAPSPRSAAARWTIDATGVVECAERQPTAASRWTATVLNNGDGIEIGGPGGGGGSTLVLDDGTTITGGTLTLEDTADVLDVVVGPSGPGGANGPGPDATLSVVTVTNAGTIEIGTGATLAIGADPTLQGGGDVLLTNGGTITGQTSGDPVTLDNVDNAIHTAEFSSGADWQRRRHRDPITEAGDLIYGDLPYSPLTLDTGNTITNAGTLEAGPNGGLTIDDSVDNSGLVESISGQLDVTASSITWTGTTPTAGTNGIVINLGGSLLIDSDALTLDGGGAVSLLNGTIEGTTAGEGATLTNADSMIGYGQINVGLINHGTIDASGSGQTLLIDTGGSAVDNDGTLSADGNSTLQINDLLNDAGTLKASGGGTIDLVGGGSSSGLIDIENGALDVNSSYSLAGHATLHVAGDVFIGTDAG